MKRIILLIIFTIFLVSCEDAIDIIRERTYTYADVQSSYSEITDETGGKRYDAINAEEVSTRLIEIIEQNGRNANDIVFLIDKTSSMRDDIDSVKTTLTAIIQKMPVGTNLALGTFGDYNVDGAEWYSITALTTDFESIKTNLNSVTTTGGGDLPESIYDSLYQTMTDLQWKSSTMRIIVFISDAMPLTEEETIHSLSEVISTAKEKSVTIFAIAIQK